MKQRQRLLAVLAWLVPGADRDAWRREWVGEMHRLRDRGDRGAAVFLRLHLAAAEDAAGLGARRFRPELSAKDLRYALRSLRRSPGYTAVAVLTLALGIGANTAIFSVIHACLLQPLPLERPDRLVTVLRDSDGRVNPTSAPNYLDWRDRSDSFADLVGIRMSADTLTGAGRPLRLTVARVTPGFFDLVGVPPEIGRGFLPDEATFGRHRTLVLAHDLWTEAFGSDPGVIGTTVALDGESYEIVGVAPRRFRVPPFEARVFVPLAFEPDALEARGRNNIWVIGRLRDGVEPAAAQAEMDVIVAALAREYPRSNEGWGVRVRSLHGFAVGDSAQGLWTLSAAVGLVLLMACANAASLTIARGLARSRDLAVRVALGASRGRIFGELAAETLLLSLIGGAIGVGCAYAALGPIAALIPAGMTRIGDVAIDGTVLGFAVVAAIASGILSGLAPGWMISRAAGRGAGIAAMADRLRNRNASMRIRRAMLVLEFAMAMTLLVGAGLFFRTLENLYAVELGVRHEGITTFRVAYPAADYPNPEDVRHAVDRTLEVLASHPDVATVEATSHLPLSGSRLTSSVIYEGGAREHGTNTPSVAIKVVTPGYSRALGIPLLAGRNLAPRDESGTEPVVVLNRAAAEMLWPGETAIGKWLSYENDDQDHPIRRRVVGVIGDVHFAGPAQPPTPEAYQSHAQTRDVWRWFGRDLTYAALTRSGRPLAVDAARDLLARVDPTLPVVGYRTLTEWLDSSVSTPRFQGTLVGLFAAVALLLAGAGTYGVMALAVRQQARDYGIRLAVGASRRAVLGGVVAGALRLAAVGTALGGTIAFLLSRSIRSLLWGVDGADTATYASVALLLTLATIAASLGPALRAARTDPVVVLKEE